MIEGISGDILDRWRWTEGNRRRSRPKIDGGSGHVLDRDLAIGLGHTDRHGGHPVAGPGVGEVVAGGQCLPMELVSGHDDNVVDQLLMLSVLISQGCYQAKSNVPFLKEAGMDNVRSVQNVPLLLTVQC